MRTIDETRPGKQAPAPGSARAALREIYRAAVEAVRPPNLLRKKLEIKGSELLVEADGGLYRFPLSGRVYLVGAGKGADLAGPVFEDLFGQRLAEGIILIRDRFYKVPLSRTLIRIGSHPLPDRRSLRGTESCLRLLRKAGHGDSVIFFFMGGTSSLLMRPAPGLTLEDKRAATELLLKSGMTISQMNCVRKHLSSVKAGGLLRAAYPARALTLALSDVPGDDPAVIGSAPTFCDPTTYEHAWETLKEHGLLRKMPRSVRRHLLRGVRGEVPETLKPGSRLLEQSRFILFGNNRDALLAAKTRAESFGFASTILTSELSGDTRTRARELSAFLKREAREGPKYARPRCYLLGGETTVRVQGKGKGGRNQEFALAAAVALAGLPGVYLLSAGSDGSDGPTDAAGAFADGETVSRARSLGLDPAMALRGNDSYVFFGSLGELFSPGPSGTNVMDLKIALLY